MNDAPRIAVLVSGRGTNLQALLDAERAGQLGGHIVATLSNRPGVQALERASAAGKPARCLDHTTFADRAAFDAALADCLDEFQPDLLVLAGFMRILTDAFIDRYAGRMLNIHPSLLPRYPGLHTHRRALEAGDREHGSTVHFVTRDLDGGPPVLQARIPVLAEDTEASLSARVQVVEHRMYPVAVRWYCSGRLYYRDASAWLDGEPLPAGGILWREDLE